MSRKEPRWVPRLVVEAIHVDQVREHGGLIDVDRFNDESRNPAGLETRSTPSGTRGSRRKMPEFS